MAGIFDFRHRRRGNIERNTHVNIDGEKRMTESEEMSREEFEKWFESVGNERSWLSKYELWLAWQAACGEALRWIPVEEKLPEHRTKVLVYREPPYSPAIQSASYWEVHSKGAGFYCGDEVKGITHWQPLPADPAQWEGK